MPLVNRSQVPSCPTLRPSTRTLYRTGTHMASRDHRSHPALTQTETIFQPAHPLAPAPHLQLQQQWQSARLALASVVAQRVRQRLQVHDACLATHHKQLPASALPQRPERMYLKFMLVFLRAYFNDALSAAWPSATW